MCGIAGIWNPGARELDLRQAIASMTLSLAHRGPDDNGMLINAPAGLGLGHRRLSILDVSTAGHQPMQSPSGRYSLVFNGEIYNFRELRADLESRGHSFRSRSDTEVLLAALETWGPEAGLARLNGMFAFAMWDAADRVLFLARDRMGEKPLYYGWAGRAFVVASELKAFAAVPEWNRRIDRGSLSVYFQHGYIPAPQTVYEDIWKLRPGHFLALGEADLQSRQPRQRCYWDLSTVAERAQRDPVDRFPEAAAERLDGLLRDSVRLRMIADVSVGALLSGGVDSSTVVAMMQAESTRPVKTFTVSFAGAAHDEAPAASRIARHLGTDHTEVRVSADEALAVIPRLPVLYDEPFADSSAVPAFIVSTIARAQVKVALSGDGGDELFAGYARYRRCERLWRGLGLLPPAARAWRRGRAAKDGVLRELLNVESDRDLYARALKLWPAEDGIVSGGSGAETAAAGEWPAALSLRRKMMLADSLRYLPDDILVKLDRASMGVSLEARTPMLDHRVVEFSWSLPDALLVRHGATKWILRKVLHRYVPRDYITGPKQGFSIPREQWLRGPLRDWAESLLEPSRLDREGYLATALIRRRWEDHVSGRANWSSHIWAVLMFQAWLEQWSRNAAAAA